MARYIAIDHGTKRIGLAIGDRETGVVTPLEVVAARNEPNADVEAVLAVVSQYAVDALVVGLPLNMDDTEGTQAKITRVFGTRLAEMSDLPVHYQDERISSFTADERLNELDPTRLQRRRHRDKLAAAAILEAYLATLP